MVPVKRTQMKRYLECNIDIVSGKYKIFILSKLATAVKLVLLWSGLVYGAEVSFVDVTQDLAIDFIHRSGISEEKRLPETDGAGVALFDYDDDGDLDLYLVNSGDLITGRGTAHNALYRNNGGVNFSSVGAEAGVLGRAYGMGVLAGDYDNDGDADLYLTNLGADQLYRNEADGSFSDATKMAGLGDIGWGSSSAYLDYDNDGDLDLFVSVYLEFELALHPWCGRRDMGLRFYCDPRQFKPTRDLLYRNEADGTFTAVADSAGIDQKGNGLGVVCGDYDLDGDADIYVANDMTPNFYYENQGNGRFADMGLLSGTAFSADGTAQAGMGVDAGDYDRDGDLDLFVTNYQLENNSLYRNDGMMFSEVSFATGIGDISLNYLGFGTGFLDYDNDGWLDLFVANGHVHDNIEQYDDLVTYAQRAQIFHNERGVRFKEQTQQLGPALAVDYVGRGSAFGDYDADGDMDIVLMSSARPVALWRNDGGNKNNWLGVVLQGTRSNHEGVGAKVYIDVGTQRLLHEVKLGGGYLSTSAKDPLFGLGQAKKAERLEIHWPSGQVQTFEAVEANQIVRAVEP